MVIKIKGSTIANEVINMNIIEKLYNLSNNIDNNCTIEGHVQTDYVYEKWIDYLEHLYNKFKCNINRELLIWFDDEEVKRVLIENLSLTNIGGVPVSKKIDLSSIQGWFHENNIIKTFNELELFKNITSLSGGAFFNCKNLEEIDLSNITFLGNQCFQLDTKLNIDINLPNLTTLQNDVFFGCTSLTTVSNLGNLTSENCGTGNFANCTNLQSVILPETLTTIKDTMFYNCTSLSEISIPASVTTINSQGLRNTAITEIDLSNITNIGASAFRDCKSLISDINAPSLITLGARAFQNCTSIKKVTSLGNITILPQSVEGGFPGGVFTGCTSLEEITLPSTLRTIENLTFNKCTSLKTIKGNNLKINYIKAEVFSYCENLETIPNILNENITEIGQRAFVKCLKLNITELNLPNLTTLGASVFAGLYKLERVISLGNTITEFGFVHGSWGDYGRVGMFQNCINLTDINIPNTVTNFGDFTFAGDVKLKNINIPLSLTTLGAHCFAACIGLSDNIFYFKNVTNISNFIFNGARVNQAYFPSLNNQFDGWWSNWSSNGGIFASNREHGWTYFNLLYLKFGSDILVKNGTFGYAEIINLVINNEIPPQIEQYTFSDYFGERCKISNIWVPAVSVETYKNAQYWSERASIIKSIDDYPYVVNTEAEYRTLQEGGDNNIYLIREYMS